MHARGVYAITYTFCLNKSVSHACVGRAEKGAFAYSSSFGQGEQLSIGRTTPDEARLVHTLYISMGFSAWMKFSDCVNTSPFQLLDSHAGVMCPANECHLRTEVVYCCKCLGGREIRNCIS